MSHPWPAYSYKYNMTCHHSWNLLVFHLRKLRVPIYEYFSTCALCGTFITGVAILNRINEQSSCRAAGRSCGQINERAGAMGQPGRLGLPWRGEGGSTVRGRQKRRDTGRAESTTEIHARDSRFSKTSTTV